MSATLARMGAFASRVWRSADAAEHVHFHGGDGGRPYPCDRPRCDSPALTVPAS